MFSGYPENVEFGSQLSEMTSNFPINVDLKAAQHAYHRLEALRFHWNISIQAPFRSTNQA